MLEEAPLPQLTDLVWTLDCLSSYQRGAAKQEKSEPEQTDFSLSTTLPLSGSGSSGSVSGELCSGSQGVNAILVFDDSGSDLSEAHSTFSVDLNAFLRERAIRRD